MGRRERFAWTVLAGAWLAIVIGYAVLVVYQLYVYAKVDRVIHEARMEMRL